MNTKAFAGVRYRPPEPEPAVRNRNHPVKPVLLVTVFGLLLAALLSNGVIPTRALAAVRQGGVNVEPSARPWRYVGANPGSWWCVQPNCIADPTASMTRELSMAHQVGAADLRLEFPWFLIEPQNGVYDWSRSDQIMTAAQAAGVTIQPVIVFTPAWAASNTTVAPNPADFAAFVTTFTRRYDHQVPVIEMWNEADHGHYWNSGEQSYVTSILNPGYAAVKAVDPAVQVEVSGTSNDPTSSGWLANLYAYGARYDIMAFHSYAGNPLAEAQSIRSVMATHGDNRPIWLGEYSVASATGDQSALLTATLTGSGPLAMAQWYNLRDDAAYNCCPAVAAAVATWGLLNTDYSSKPSFATMQSLLGGASVPNPSPTPTPAPLSPMQAVVPNPTPSVTPSPTSTRSPASAPSAAPAPATGGLHARGNQIVDANGAPVLLRGANMAGTEFVCAQGWSNDPFGGQPEDSAATFAAMQSWHINFVRIPLNEDCWLGINGARIGGAAYQTAIVKLVHDLRVAGFYVIVDLHWSAPGAQLALSQNPVPDEDHSPAFWKSVAATFSTDQGVVYDLFNEPFLYWIAPGGPDQWTCLMRGCVLSQYETGGTPFTVAANWQSAGMNELIADVRGTGAQNLIMVAGANWARDLSGWLGNRPSDTNVAASWHSYPSGNPSLISECAAQACWDSVVAPLAQQVPVVVGETGDSSAGAQTYLPAFLPWAGGHGLSVVAWTWNAWANPDDVLVSDMQTGTPTAGEGVTYRAWIAGQAIPSPAPPPSPSPSTAPSLSPSAITTPSPSPSPSTLPTPSTSASPSLSPLPSPGTVGVLMSDSFEADAVGSLPSGWTGFGVNSAFTTQVQGSHVLNHGGWSGSLKAGSAAWSNYIFSVAVKPSCWLSENDGLMFGISESGHYSLDIVGGNKLVLGKTVGGTGHQITTGAYIFDPWRWYTVSVSFDGGSITAFVNGVQVLQATDSSFAAGAIGLESNDPVVFDNVLVTQSGTPIPILVSPTPRL